MPYDVDQREGQAGLALPRAAGPRPFVAASDPWVVPRQAETFSRADNSVPAGTCFMTWKWP